LLVLT